MAKPTSSSQHQGPNGSGTKAHDRNQEVGVCPCALQAQKGTGPVRKSTCRSQSQHFAIRSFLREARRAKPLMSWRRLYRRKSAKLRFRMCYILSIERQLLRHSPLKKERKGNTHGQREGCRSASRSHGIRQNLEQHFPSLAFIDK